MSNVAPSSNRVQQESVQFNQPVSESSIASVAALANYLRDVTAPVGTIIHSMLTEAQFNTLVGSATTTWVLADGRSVTGSVYETITGSNTVPDLRGLYLRGKNNGRTDGAQNPDGDLSLGTYQADVFTSHSHSASDSGHTHNSIIREGTENVGTGTAGLLQGIWFSFNGDGSAATTTSHANISVANSGGNETRPKSTTTNIFIRIN